MRIILFFVVVLAVASPRIFAQNGGAKEKPASAVSPSEEMVRLWKEIHRKLIAMAEDFPEEKLDFRGQKEQRTFAENLLHVAGEDYRMISAIKGEQVGWHGSGDPARADFKTREDIVRLLKQATADGEKVITQQGDEGLSREIKYPYGNRMVHASYGWSDIIEHAGEHYGQLVVYYRINQLIPPESRLQK